MRKLFLSILHFLFISLAFGQSPSVQWWKYKKGVLDGLYFNDVLQMDDGSYVLGGTLRWVGTETQNEIYSKFTSSEMQQGCSTLLVKSSIDGSFLGSNFSHTSNIITSLEMSHDGNIIACAAGDKSINIYKINKNFNTTGYSFDESIIWYKKYGGSNDENPYCIKKTKDNGYVIVGTTSSSDGDVNQPNKGLTDAWIIKIDIDGNLIWSKTFGGSGDDFAQSITVLSDGYIVSGYSTSTDGDIGANNGQKDAWIFKLDINGDLKWQRNIGGSGDDDLNAVIWDSAENKLVFSGYSNSNDFNLSNNKGDQDFWVLKTNLNGEIEWSKLFGGSFTDASFCIKQLKDDGNYVITGFTTSKDKDIIKNYGGSDIWTLLVDKSGKLVWQNTIGKSTNDFSTAISVLSHTDFTLAGNWEYKQEPYTFLNSGYVLVKYGNSNVIRGNIFFDLNKNNRKDVGELSLDQVNIQAKKNRESSKIAIPYNGDYRISLDTGNYQITAKPYHPYYTSIPTSVNISYNTYYNIDTIDFAIQPKPGIKDLSINLLPLTPARPGFAIQYKMIVSNDGTENIPASTVSLIKDSRLIFQNASLMPTITNDDTLKWTINNFAPSDTAVFTINFKAVIPPGLNNGDTLKSTASIQLENDTLPSNNVFDLKQRVTGSYDPNDKRESHGGIITEEQLANDRWLNYLIRFQNTGTDTAFTVTVKDTLSTKVDWSTLELIDASHPHKMEMENGRITWLFENIMLVDSNKNQPKSHGFVAFKIKVDSTMQIGDIISNEASIYFDYNEPVATNLDLVKIGFSIIEDTNIVRVCQKESAFFQVPTANVKTYTWEVDEGAGFNTIPSNNRYYNGINTAQLSVTGPTSLTGFKFRCLMQFNDGSTKYSNVKMLRFVNTWLGTTNADWRYAGNWGCGILPDAYTDVIVKSPANNLVVTGDVSCRSITLTGPNIYIFVKKGFKLNIIGK